MRWYPIKISDHGKRMAWRIGFHGAAAAFYTILLSSFMANGYVIFVGRMITAWYLILHIVFVYLLVLQDVSHFFLGRLPKINATISKINNILFISIVFPFALYIPLAYWSLFYYDSNLIHPAFLEISMPSWVSKSSHSIISLVALLEMVTTEYTYDGNYIVALTLLAIFSGCYATCLIHTFTQYGFWIYPVFHSIPEDILPFVFVLLAALLICMFFLGAVVANLVRNKNKRSEDTTNEASPDDPNPQMPPAKPPRSLGESYKAYFGRAEYTSGPNHAGTVNRSETDVSEFSLETIDDLPPPPSPPETGYGVAHQSHKHADSAQKQASPTVSIQKTPFFFNSTGKRDNEPKIRRKPTTYSFDVILPGENEDSSKSEETRESAPNEGDGKANDDERSSAIGKSFEFIVKSSRTSTKTRVNDKESNPDASQKVGTVEGQRTVKRYSHLRDFARDNDDSTIMKYRKRRDKFTSDTVNTFDTRNAEGTSSTQNTANDFATKPTTSMLKSTDNVTDAVVQDQEHPAHGLDSAYSSTNYQTTPGSVSPQSSKNIVSFSPTVKEVAERTVEEKGTGLPSDQVVDEEQHRSLKTDSADSLEPFPLITPFGHRFPQRTENHRPDGLEDLVSKKDESAVNLYTRTPKQRKDNVSEGFNLPFYQDEMVVEEKYDTGKRFRLDKIRFLMQRKSKIPKRKRILGAQMEHRSCTLGKSGSIDGLTRPKINSIRADEEQGEPSGDGGKSASGDMVVNVTPSNVKRRRIARGKDDQNDTMTICLVIT